MEQSSERKVSSSTSTRSIGSWEPSGNCVKTIIVNEDKTGFEDLIMGPSNVLISASCNDKLAFWNTDTSECLKTLRPAKGAFCLALDRQKGTVISGDRSGNINFWDLEKMEAVRKEHGAHLGSIYDMLVDSRHNQLITASGEEAAPIRVCNLDTLECVRVLGGHEAFVKCLAMKDDLVMSGSKDETIRVYDVKSGACLRTLSGHKSMIWCMTVSGGQLISGCGKGLLKLWDIETGACVREELERGLNGIICTLIGHRGELIYSSWDRTIKFVDIRNSRVVKTIRESHESSVTAMTLLEGSKAAKNHLVSAGGDGTIKFWEI